MCFILFFSITVAESNILETAVCVEMQDPGVYSIQNFMNIPKMYNKSVPSYCKYHLHQISLSALHVCLLIVYAHSRHPLFHSWNRTKEKKWKICINLSKKCKRNALYTLSKMVKSIKTNPTIEVWTRLCWFNIILYTHKLPPPILLSFKFSLVRISSDEGFPIEPSRRTILQIVQDQPQCLASNIPSVWGFLLYICPSDVSLKSYVPSDTSMHMKESRAA